MLCRVVSEDHPVYLTVKYIFGIVTAVFRVRGPTATKLGKITTHNE